MSRRPDLLVLGGGPAGATVAALAAAAGVRVLLLERERFPRDKVCGGFVSAEGVSVLARLGIIDSLRAAGAVDMDSCRVTDPAGRSALSKLPAQAEGDCTATGLSRALLDQTLLQLAERRGVEIRDRVEATVPIVSGGRVIGARYRPVGSRVFGEAATAAVVIAADGRRSSLARALHPSAGDPARTGGGSWFGLQAYIDGARVPEDGRVELCLFQGGYAGISNIEDGRINLCFLTTVDALRLRGGSPERLVRETVLRNPVAAEILRDAELPANFRSIGPLHFGPRRAHGSGALFLGDAAGTVDPFCGEGISLALRSAELALPAVLEAAATGELTSEVARRYERAWSRLFDPVSRRTSFLGWVLHHPKAASATLAVLALGNSALFSKVIAATRSGTRYTSTS